MKCRLCNEEYDVESCCVSSETIYDKQEEPTPYISIQGFVERRKCCKKPLGEGYGDVNFYKTKKEADEWTNKWKEKIGQWW